MQPTVSCSVACGVAKQQIDLIAGCVASAASTSAGMMVSPPRLIASLVRATTKRLPSSSM